MHQQRETTPVIDGDIDDGIDILEGFAQAQRHLADEILRQVAQLKAARRT